MSSCIKVSAVIPTYRRVNPLMRTLNSLAIQSQQFAEVIIVDSSDDNETENMLLQGISNLDSKIVYKRASVKGAASQRNEGVALARYEFIAFMDDDVYLEPGCTEELFKCFEIHREAGAVSAMITNQKYIAPGKFTRLIATLVNGKSLDSYAGKCIGPAWNFLPDDDTSLPEFVQVDWLNLGLTIYKREHLPSPPFQKHFHGYSMMEDLTLSLIVGKKAKLYNARNARIFHDSQPGQHKSNVRELERMELINRHFIMTNVLNRKTLGNHVELAVLEVFKLMSLFNSFQSIKKLPSAIVGKISALTHLLFRKTEGKF